MPSIPENAVDGAIVVTGVAGYVASRVDQARQARKTGEAGQGGKAGDKGNGRKSKS
ncbi:hypothetical protein GCM10023195_42680 [Actinoallomurus liliacearum]|uniref:Uncharacterized protein n=1 Tax=Actinoallomurus liliacearum TaxID=1080073 RepID=A0ABP8TMT4_9ACTN